jgi:hypothetical protein
MPQFAILVREDNGAWGKLPTDEQARLMGLYGAWVRDLAATGAFVGGAPLGGPARLLRSVGSEIVDGPWTQTTQVLTGYFLVEAADLAAATALARGCPALLHGETVEVRPVGHI